MSISILCAAVLLWHALFKPVEALRGIEVSELAAGTDRLFVQTHRGGPDRLLVVHLEGMRVEDVTSKLVGRFDHGVSFEYDQSARELWVQDDAGFKGCYDENLVLKRRTHWKKMSREPFVKKRAALVKRLPQEEGEWQWGAFSMQHDRWAVAALTRGRIWLLRDGMKRRVVFREIEGDEPIGGAIGDCVGFLGTSSGSVVVFPLRGGASKIYRYRPDYRATFEHIYWMAIAQGQVFLVDYNLELWSAPLSAFEPPDCNSASGSGSKAPK